MWTGVSFLLFAAILVGLLVARSRAVMPRPTSIEPWVIEAFRRENRKQWLLGILLAPPFIYLEWGHKATGAALGSPDIALLFLITAVACLFTYKNWRCPKCGAYLGRRPLYYGVCPKCGTALREPIK